MAWDATKPSNSQKLRDSPASITDNWSAIVNADATFKPVAINLASQVVDATAIAATNILYCKSGATYIIDASSNKYRISGNKYTETVNGGTAGGTLYKTEIYVKDGYRIVTYSGTTTAFSGNKTVVFPENFTAIYTGVVSANDVNVQKTSVSSGVGGLTIYTENSVAINWFAQGRIN